MIKSEHIKEGVILIDAGINQVVSKEESMPGKRKIVGDISRESYSKASMYTVVPGGVGLLTVAALGYNVLNSYLLQNKLPVNLLKDHLYKKEKLDRFIEKSNKKSQNVKVLLISSGYNGLTQRINRTLNCKGYEVAFQAVTSP